MNPMKNFKSFTTLLLTALPLHAEITPDASLGTQVIKIGQESFIRIGTQNGPNLFHSFSNFDINTGEIATFVGPTIIENIINRVTGGTTSNIDGLIRSSIPGANLYLLNPAGVLFGPNAALDISGSFHVSSADYINLGNNGPLRCKPTRQYRAQRRPTQCVWFSWQLTGGYSILGQRLAHPGG